MKKNLLISLCAGFGFFVSSFSQTNGEIIQRYINSNAQKFQLTNQETKDWQVVNITSSETTGIENCYVKQSYQGIEIFQSYIYFWIKNKEIINEPTGFINALSTKVNTVQPQLNAIEGLSRALTQLGEVSFNSTIIENQGNIYKLSNGILNDDPVNARLIYYVAADKKLYLAWSYEFYTQNEEHLWYVQIDAQSGNILEKRDLILSCNYEEMNHSNHEHSKELNSEFLNIFFKAETSHALLTPGTTTYNVVPFNYESPIHYRAAFPAATDGRTIITNPESAIALPPLTIAASPNGWHNNHNTIGGGNTSTQFAYTRGNNVFAFSDFNNDNPTNPTSYATPSSGTYPSLTFDYSYGGNNVEAQTYINASITNLFYMNNIMHDIWYQYGFNETNRNFQNVNYNRGGIGNDYVLAHAQDASTGNNNPTNGQTIGVPLYNNANFSTSSEGTRPRMQMYLWNYKKKINLVVNTGNLSGNIYKVNDNVFSPGHVELPIAPSTLTNDLVLVNDGNAPDTSDGCESITNGAALNGKIAVIRRGVCNFVFKVNAAQTAGAVGVIIVNNQSGEINMNGSDTSITIPAVSINQLDGETLINAMSAGSVNISLSNSEVFINTDADFDNGIIAHEYGHGISNRLVGGGGGLNSSEQPGEGWSDFFALMMQIKTGDTRNDAKGIGTFAANQTTDEIGIRQYKYSTNMNINPHTFGSTNGMLRSGGTAVDVHSVGSVWAVMLWDLAWNYIDKYGYSSNIYNGTAGNNKVMRLVVDALKLTPANPSLIQCRDAIIAADQATTGGQDYCMIWKTFARRGLGVNASSGTNSGTAGIQDQVEDFTEPAPGPNCTLSVNHFDNNNGILIYPNPSNGLINIRINSFIGKATLEVVDINGRVVYSLNNTEFNNEKSIDLNHLQAGVYVLKISGDELNYTKKIILN